ncbi:MAG: hypothetical protein ACLFVJ_18500 [Persicimonas sp.]
MVALLWLVGSVVVGIGGAAFGMDPASQQEMMKNAPAGGDNPFVFLEMMGPGYWAFLGLSVILGFVNVGVGVASFAPLRRAWVEERNLSISEVLGELGNRIIPGALLYFVFSIGFTVGAILCCIPGLLVGYFMLPTFYLVGGRGNGVFESLETGFEWGKKHVALLAIFIAAGIMVGLAMVCVAGAIGQVVLTMGKVGYVLSQLMSWFIGVTLGFFIWLYYAAMMLTIEQALTSKVTL